MQTIVTFDKRPRR